MSNSKIIEEDVLQWWCLSSIVWISGTEHWCAPLDVSALPLNGRVRTGVELSRVGLQKSRKQKNRKPRPASQWTRGDSTDCVAPVCDVLTIERTEGTKECTRSGTTSRISWGRSDVACLAGNLESGRPKEPKPSPASQWTRGDSTDCVAPVCDVLTIERKEGTDVKLSAWSGARSRLSSSRSCPPIPSQWSRPGLR